MHLIPCANSLKYTHSLGNLLIFRFFVAFLVLAKSMITPDFQLDVITSFGSYELAHYWRHFGEL